MPPCRLRCFQFSRPHYLVDHSWVHLTCREVSSAFHLVFLSNDVKVWLDSLAVEFVRLFPLSRLLSALRVLRTWEGPLLKALVKKPSQALAYMQNRGETYPPPPRNSVTWQGAYGGSASEWRVLSPTGFLPAPLAMRGPLNQRLHYGRWWGPPTDQAVPPPAVEALPWQCKQAP